MKRQEHVILAVEWEPCEGSQDIAIRDSYDLRDYIYSTLQSNADFDHVKMKILHISSIAEPR